MSGHSTATTHDEKREPKIYAAVLGALLILTFITVGASYISFGSGMTNVIIALTIATIKASLVGLFFMHLAHDKPINSIIFVSSLFFVAILLISCYQDEITRDVYRPANLKVQTTPVKQGTNPAPTAPPPATTTVQPTQTPATSAPAH